MNRTLFFRRYAEFLPWQTSSSASTLAETLARVKDGLAIGVMAASLQRAGLVQLPFSYFADYRFAFSFSAASAASARPKHGFLAGYQSIDN